MSRGFQHQVNDRFRSAFSLFEMICVLSLMGTFFFVATHLFRSSVRMIENAEASQSGAARIDHLLAALRRDVWSSTSMSAPTGQTLSLKQGNADTVTWSTTADGGVKRIQAGSANDEQSWPAAPAVTFSVEGSVVMLDIASGGAKEQIELTSQLQSLRGGAR